MIARNETATDLMHRRAESVALVSALHAKALKLRQAIAGSEMDILRIELDITKNPASGDLVRELHDTEETAVTMQAALAGLTEEIIAAEADVAAVDRLIETEKGG